jgi:hypothetical protein
MNYNITFRIQNALKLTCKHLQYQFSWVIPRTPAEKGREGDGEGLEEGREREEFVLCSKKKKKEK